jgi:hypothetical protein
VPHFAVDINPLHLLPNPVEIGFKWIASGLHNLSKGLVTLYEKLIIHPVYPNPGSWSDNLFANSLGLAEGLAYAVAIILVCVSVVWHRRAISAAHAIFNMAMIAAIGPSYFWFCDWVLSNFGERISKAFLKMSEIGGGSHSGLLSLPSIADPLGALFGFGSILFFGTWLVMFFYIYALLIFFVKFFGLIAFALKPLGPRSEKNFNAVVSIGLVTLVFGRPLAIFILELGKLASDHLNPGTTSFGDSFWLSASFITAIGAQIWLWWITIKTVNNVLGHVSSTARVSGKVQTESVNRQKVDANVVNSRFAASMKPAAASQGAMPLKNVASLEAKRRLAGAAIEKAIPAAKAVGGKIHPGVAAAMAATDVAASKAKAYSGNTNNDNHQQPAQEEQ